MAPCVDALDRALGVLHGVDVYGVSPEDEAQVFECIHVHQPDDLYKTPLRVFGSSAPTRHGVAWLTFREMREAWVYRLRPMLVRSGLARLAPFDIWAGELVVGNPDWYVVLPSVASRSDARLLSVVGVDHAPRTPEQHEVCIALSYLFGEYVVEPYDQDGEVWLRCQLAEDLRSGVSQERVAVLRAFPQFARLPEKQDPGQSGGARGLPRASLIEAVRAEPGMEFWSEGTFDNIRKKSGVKARAKGGKGKTEVFSWDEIRTMRDYLPKSNHRDAKAISHAFDKVLATSAVAA